MYYLSAGARSQMSAAINPRPATHKVSRTQEQNLRDSYTTITVRYIPLSEAHKGSLASWSQMDACSVILET